MDTKKVYNCDETTLASTEKLLQILMQDISYFLNLSDLSLSSECHSEALRLMEVGLRQKMRALRRWRNGADLYNADDLTAFQRDLDTARLESMRLRIIVLSDVFDYMDISSGATISNNLFIRKKSIERAISDLKDQHASISNEDCETKIKSMHHDILNLRKSLESESARERKTSHQVTVKSTVKQKRTQKFEEHPEVNRVLRCVSRIRAMMEAFRRGYHVIIDESPGCGDNDLEVLQRQLHKVQLWQESVRSFSTSEVDDLEVILGAIEKHVEPTFDLDSPSKVAKSGSSRSSSRPNSRLSETSSEAQYMDPPSISSDAPPTYKEACLSDTDPEQDGTDSDIALVNERLI